jgi:hypothetical protein
MPKRLQEKRINARSPSLLRGAAIVVVLVAIAVASLLTAAGSTSEPTRSSAPVWSH